MTTAHDDLAALVAGKPRNPTEIYARLQQALAAAAAVRLGAAVWTPIGDRYIGAYPQSGKLRG